MTHRAELGSRALFPALEARAYLNHAAISPPSQAVTDAMLSTLQLYAARGVGAFVPTLEQREALRATLAALVGAQTDEIGYVANTSTGVIAIATCFPWQRGDGVVVFKGEFPTNVTPWQRATAREGLRLAMLDLPPTSDPQAVLEPLEAELKRGVALVAVSAVQFQTGLRMPLAAMGELCHRYGAALFVDAIQACGVVPIDVDAMHIDFLSCGSHKWLMGTEGAAFVVVRQRWADTLRPHLAGWLSHQDGLKFLFEGAGHLRYDRPFKHGAEQLEAGAPNAIGLVGLKASVELIAQIGVAAIYDHVQAYHDRLEPRLLERGFTIARSPKTDRRSDGRSGILACRPPPSDDVANVVERLRRHDISVAMPDGWLRFAPHWPNNASEVDLIVAALDDR